jgi:hypothetical protein
MTYQSEDLKAITYIFAMESRLVALRTALEAIENLGAEHHEDNLTEQMFRIANDALWVDDQKRDLP